MNEAAAAAGLPVESVPFPVAAEYRIQPDLKRLAEGENHFLLDDAWPRYLARKLELLAARPDECRVAAGESAELVRGLWQVAELFAGEYPARCRVTVDALELPPLGVRLQRSGEVVPLSERGEDRLSSSVLNHLRGLSPFARLADALAFSVQEDLVLVAGPPGNDSAQLLHVCFPSHWNPGERRGASFRLLHEPVPHNERLLAGSRNLMAAMLDKGPFVRHVWSLTATPHLDQNPLRPHPHEHSANASRKVIGGLHLRSERQTTISLASYALFTIRVYVAPLREVLDAGRARLMAASIRSMDEQLLAYKGLTELRDSLLDELDVISDY